MRLAGAFWLQVSCNSYVGPKPKAGNDSRYEWKEQVETGDMEGRFLNLKKTKKNQLYISGLGRISILQSDPRIGCTYTGNRTRGCPGHHSLDEMKAGYVNPLNEVSYGCEAEAD